MVAANNNFAPSLDINPAGNVEVLWQQQDSTGPYTSIYESRFTAPSAPTVAPPGSATYYLQTDITDPLGNLTTYKHDSAGRLSSVSPVGAALLGATPGADVEVRTPRGPVRYRVLAVD